LEKHLLTIQAEALKYKPEIVVVDALTDFISLGGFNEVRQMILRVVDFLKMHEITAMFTSMSESAATEQTGVGLSSAFDTWIHLSNVQGNLERNRTLVVVKSRGMAHSNQVREFVMSSKGVELVDIYSTAAGAFMGTARLAQMAADEASDVVRQDGVASRERQMAEKRRALEARIDAMRADFEVELKESEMVIAEEKARDKALAAGRKTLANHREVKQSAGKGGKVK